MESIEQFFSAVWAGLVSFFVWLGLASAPPSDGYQGYVEGEFVYVSATIGGILQDVSVSRGVQVSAGQTLFTLDDAEVAAARDAAAAALEQARNRRANLAESRRAPEIDALQAQIAQAEIASRLARQQLERQRRLAESSAFSEEKFDQAKAEYDTQRARIVELGAQLAAAKMAVGREYELRAADAEIEAAAAALAQAQWRLDRMSAVAPAAGVVADVFFDSGETVTSGQPVVSILPPENRKVRFFVPEASLAALPVGAAVEIKCDGCKSNIPARVTYVSETAEYTPPVLYNRDNRERLVFMVEAHPLENAELLRPGQPVDVAPTAQ